MICKGCRKQFSIPPCLKRKANYSSIKCYWDSTNLKQVGVCKRCGKEFWADNALIQKGFGFYCNKDCQFEDYPSRVDKRCPKCGEVFIVPPSWGKYRKFCSEKCLNEINRKCGIFNEKYNTRRYHQSLGYKTQMQYLQLLQEEKEDKLYVM